MPKGSPELTEKRKNEILDACEIIYREQGFNGVNIKEISTRISLTRPAVYNYFETKEEILLGLLAREYDGWCRDLEEVISLAASASPSMLAAQIAHTLEEKEIFLRILNMNLFEIEQNSRVERLADFKRLYGRATKALTEILHTFEAEVTSSECVEFCETFFAFLFGVYPFTVHTEKQLAAMELAGVSVHEPDIYEMVYRCVLRLLPTDKTK